MSRKPLHAKMLDFLGDLYKSLRFSFHHLQAKKRFGNYYFPYRSLHKGETANILANGPSLNAELKILQEENMRLENSLVVNYFSFSPLFFQIKPKYYCLADPLFFSESRYTESVYKLFMNLNNVSWKMELFVWIQGVDTIKKYVQNKNITIVGISTLQYEGFESKRNEFLKTGRAVPSFVNVTIMGLYVLLNRGYDTINLYGVDHTFLKEIVIDDENDLCVLNHHFYGDEFRKIIEIREGIK